MQSLEINMNNEDDINIFDYLIVLAKRKKLIVFVTLFFAVIALIHTYTTPLIYTAKTTVLPPIRTKSNIQQMLGELPGFNLAGLSDNSSSLTDPNVLTEILNTRTVSEIVESKLRSMEKYKDIKSLKGLTSKIALGPNKENPSHAIIISVKNKDPELAADIANIAVEALNECMQQIAITSTSQKRLFYEEQLKEARENLIKAEQDMAEFQEKTGILKVENQTGAVLESIFKIKSQISAKEVDLRVMKSYSSPSNPDLQKEEEAIRALKIELAKLVNKEGNSRDPLMSLDKMPSISRDYIRKLRELEFHQKIFNLMLNQYESAKVEEAHSPLILQVIERAVAPSKATRQIFKKLVIITFTAFFLSVLAAFFLEYIEKQLAIEENRDRVKTIKKYLSFKRNN